MGRPGLLAALPASGHTVSNLEGERPGRERCKTTAGDNLTLGPGRKAKGPNTCASTKNMEEGPRGEPRSPLCRSCISCLVTGEALVWGGGLSPGWLPWPLSTPTHLSPSAGDFPGLYYFSSPASIHPSGQIGPSLPLEETSPSSHHSQTLYSRQGPAPSPGVEQVSQA